MNYVELKSNGDGGGCFREHVLIELCRIEIVFEPLNVSPFLVLIELCRIEIDKKTEGVSILKIVLIELCRIEMKLNPPNRPTRRVLIELCRIEIIHEVMKISRRQVLIELCRIEIGFWRDFPTEPPVVLIELCRIEMPQAFVHKRGSKRLN